MQFAQVSRGEGTQKRRPNDAGGAVHAPEEGADALLLVTEWKEFRSPDFDEVAKLLKEKVIFDGRNQYNRDRLVPLGFEYYPIGVPAVRG